MTTSDMDDVPSNQTMYMLPASFAQQRLSFLDQPSPTGWSISARTTIICMHSPLSLPRIHRTRECGEDKGYFPRNFLVRL